jgi:excisionase family DNA binding protein
MQRIALSADERGDRAASPDSHKNLPVRRLALSPNESAEALGVSRDYFDRHVAPELRMVRRGRRRLVPLRELERWLDAEAARAVGPARSTR